uniref:Uncharacterized protein n=1 Tax=Arundo donax TaxID=35708 RepID=A0A0A8YB62_ARUDO
MVSTYPNQKFYVHFFLVYFCISHKHFLDCLFRFLGIKGKVAYISIEEQMSKEVVTLTLHR